LCTTTPKQQYNNSELKRSYPQITTFIQPHTNNKGPEHNTGFFVWKLPGDQATKKKRKEAKEKKKY
jgi:hypothetical protein